MSRDDRRPEPTDSLDGERELSRLYRDEAEPPEALDRSILAASREAVADVGVEPAAPRRWPTALAMAAVLVLAVTLVTLLPREPWVLAPEPATPVPALQSDPAATERRVAPAESELAAPATKSLQSAPADRARGLVPPSAAEQADAVEPAPRVASPTGRVDPERWQRRIWALIELGDYAQAQRELTAFRESYPDYPAGDLERRLGATPE